MMKEKGWSILFLTLAYLVLLGHSIIPHHHGNAPEFIFLLSNHFDQDKTIAHNVHPFEEGHQDPTDLCNCFLNNSFLNRTPSPRISVPTYELACFAPGIHEGNKDMDWFWNRLSKSIRNISVQSKVPKLTRYFSRNDSLRAPPII